MKKLIITILLLFPSLVLAQNQPLDVIINEIAWMGTKASSHDEWIELYNNTDQDIELNGWALEEEGEKIEPLKGIIKANSYFLIERTDDSTIKNIEADQEPTGWSGYGLNNSGEYLILKNKNSKIIDEVNCLNGWFAGDKEENKTMERIKPKELGSNPNNWKTNSSSTYALDSDNNLINGTPKSQNSLIQKKKIKKDYSNKIIINEILPSPEGADSKKEWIELKNIGDKKINLINWRLEDQRGVTTTYSLQEKTIKPNSFLVFSRTSTNITLNNSGDCLKLIQPNKDVLDSVCYEKAPLDKSYSQIQSQWIWTNRITKNKENLTDKDKEENKNEEVIIKNNSEEEINTNNKEEIKKINKNQEKNKQNKFFNTLLIGSLVSFLFSFFVLKLKKKINKKFDFQ